ncbi:single-stranded DNA cytosine deaminase-like isoform X2 [Vanacampus margaritifer]
MEAANAKAEEKAKEEEKAKAKAEAIAKSRAQWTQKEFLFNYENLEMAGGRHETYLCYELMTSEGASGLKHLRNIPKGTIGIPDGKHVEVLLLEDLKDRKTITQVKCYLSWSPCKDCSQTLIQFSEENPEVDLIIYASRLYYANLNCKDEILVRETRAQLRNLAAVDKVCIKIMNKEDFEYCWKRLDFGPGKEFKAWEELDENHNYYKEELKKILAQDPLDAAAEVLRNLQVEDF